MKTRFILSLLLVVGWLIGMRAQSIPVADWPQWRGLQRDGVSTDVGLAAEWPDGGPPRVWSASGLGAGYGSLAVTGGRVFVQALRGQQSMVHMPECR